MSVFVLSLIFWVSDFVFMSLILPIKVNPTINL